MDSENALSDTTKTEAPPFPPTLPQEDVDRMSLKEAAEYASRMAQAAVARYAGRPDLLLKENPHRDFRRPSEDVETQANRLGAALTAEEALAGLQKLAAEKVAKDKQADAAQSPVAPPLVPNLPQEEFDRMTLKEKAEYAGRQAQAAIARYAGRPELLLKEQPHRNFLNPPKDDKPDQK